MKKPIILVILILLLAGCSQQEAQEENIKNCKDRGGNPKITYCGGSSNMICKIECFIED